MGEAAEAAAVSLLLEVESAVVFGFFFRSGFDMGLRHHYLYLQRLPLWNLPDCVHLPRDLISLENLNHFSLVGICLQPGF